MLGHVGASAGHGLGIGHPELGQANASMVLECAHRGNEHRYRGLESARSALEV